MMSEQQNNFGVAKMAKKLLLKNTVANVKIN